MSIRWVSLFILFCWIPAHAAPKPAEFHVYNTAMADFIRKLDETSTSKVVKDLKDPADKKMFEELVPLLKGAPIRLFPLFDSLIIEGTKKNLTVITLKSKSPLRIQVNAGPEITIDANAIAKSVMNRKVSLMSWAVPEVWAADDGDSKWAFLYGALTRSSDFQAQVKNLEYNYGLNGAKNTGDYEKGLAKDMDEFLKWSKVKAMSCIDSKGLTARRLILVGADSKQTTVFCADDKLNCIFTHQDGGDVQAQDAGSRDKLVEAGIGAIRKLGDDEEIQPNQIDLKCGRPDDGNQFSKGPACFAEIKESEMSHFTPKTRDALMFTNILPNLPKAEADAYMHWHDLNVPPKNIRDLKQRGAIAALAMCCQDEVCRKQVRQETKIPMKMEPATAH